MGLVVWIVQKSLVDLLAQLQAVYPQEDSDYLQQCVYSHCDVHMRLPQLAWSVQILPDQVDKHQY